VITLGQARPGQQQTGLGQVHHVPGGGHGVDGSLGGGARLDGETGGQEDVAQVDVENRRETAGRPERGIGGGRPLQPLESGRNVAAPAVEKAEVVQRAR
jgi:hypothetical protein